ncbi:hypothetical protein [Sphaerimonospora thailandensis]|uniref:hypothetical protein n=1 Tax=Sphaerimonospora thailandensis TaxID=795644 RepID=UPI00194F96C1|nr:hypothetical protein [Sphaerimonospora thailandensis]
MRRLASLCLAGLSAIIMLHFLFCAVDHHSGIEAPGAVAAAADHHPGGPQHDHEVDCGNQAAFSQDANPWSAGFPLLGLLFIGRILLRADPFRPFVRCAGSSRRPVPLAGMGLLTVLCMSRT